MANLSEDTQRRVFAAGLASTNTNPDPVQGMRQETTAVFIAGVVVGLILGLATMGVVALQVLT